MFKLYLHYKFYFTLQTPLQMPYERWKYASESIPYQRYQ